MIDLVRVTQGETIIWGDVSLRSHSVSDSSNSVGRISQVHTVGTSECLRVTPVPNPAPAKFLSIRDMNATTCADENTCMQFDPIEITQKAPIVFRFVRIRLILLRVISISWIIVWGRRFWNRCPISTTNMTKLPCNRRPMLGMGLENMGLENAVSADLKPTKSQKCSRL